MKKPPKPKKKIKPSLSQKEKFIAYAEQEGVDTTGRSFKKLFKEIVPQKEV